MPARDEAEVVAALAGLLLQEYPGAFHVILVDDHSADGTAQVAAAMAKELGREMQLTLVAAREPPAGWAGKVWAQSEGLAVRQRRLPAARFVWLTDADILHEPMVLKQLVTCAEAEQRVLTSLMVRLRCGSAAERMLIPAFVFFFAMLYLFSRVNNSRGRIATAAGGCMLVRTDALERCGGLSFIKDALIDDCALAARMKRQGPIRLDLAQDSYSLCAYGDWTGIWNMIARSAYTQLRHSPWRLAATVCGMFLVFLAPPPCAVAALVLHMGYAAAPALAAWLFMALVYAPMLRYYRQSRGRAPALPLVALFYLAATLASAWRYRQGRGGQWKGRAQAIRPPHFK